MAEAPGEHPWVARCRRGTGPVRVIAHRGGAALHPENTLAGLRRRARAGGGRHRARRPAVTRWPGRRHPRRRPRSHDRRHRAGRGLHRRGARRRRCRLPVRSRAGTPLARPRPRRPDARRRPPAIPGPAVHHRAEGHRAGGGARRDRGRRACAGARPRVLRRVRGRHAARGPRGRARLLHRRRDRGDPVGPLQVLRAVAARTRALRGLPGAGAGERDGDRLPAVRAPRGAGRTAGAGVDRERRGRHAAAGRLGRRRDHHRSSRSRRAGVSSGLDELARHDERQSPGPRRRVSRGRAATPPRNSSTVTKATYPVAGPAGW